MKKTNSRRHRAQAKALRRIARKHDAIANELDNSKKTKRLRIVLGRLVHA